MGARRVESLRVLVLAFRELELLLPGAVPELRDLVLRAAPAEVNSVCVAIQETPFFDLVTGGPSREDPLESALLIPPEFGYAEAVCTDRTALDEYLLLIGETDDVTISLEPDNFPVGGEFDESDGVTDIILDHGFLTLESFAGLDLVVGMPLDTLTGDTVTDLMLQTPVLAPFDPVTQLTPFVQEAGFTYLTVIVVFRLLRHGLDDGRCREQWIP